MTYASPTRARELYAGWIERHPELASKTPMLASAIRWEVWRRSLTAANRKEGAVGIPKGEYDMIAARLVSRLRAQRYGALEYLQDGEWWSQIEAIGAEIGWTPPRHIFFRAERKAMEAA